MGTKALLSAVAVSSALLGCQAMPPAGGHHFVAKSQTKVECADESQACVVKVDVRNCATRCYLAVSDDLVVITGKKKVSVTWLLTNASFKFDRDAGIVVHGDSRDDFKCKIDPDDATKYVCTNKHSAFGAYKYTVLVVGVDPLDPWIIND